MHKTSYCNLCKIPYCNLHPGMVSYNRPKGQQLTTRLATATCKALVVEHEAARCTLKTEQRY